MKYVIALDIGGTNMRFALIDQNYQIEQLISLSTKQGNLQLFYEQVITGIKQLDYLNKQVVAISVGVPGQVNKHEHILTLPNIKISNVSLKPFLIKHFNLPVFIRNDAVMACLAEANLGVGKHYQSLYFVTISTGLGGAMALNHQFIDTSDEIGHTLFLYQNNYYELEHLASGSGIITLAKLNNLEVTSAQHFFSLYEQKDPLAIKVFEDWFSLTLKFFNLVHHLFTPDVFAITGGVLHSERHFWNRWQEQLSHLVIKKTHFGDKAGLIGAANIAFSHIFNEIKV